MRRRAAALRVRLCGSSSTASVAVLNGMRSPIAPNLCDALRAARPAFEADQRGLRRFQSNRMSSSVVSLTAGPAPAIVTYSARHSCLPRPAPRTRRWSARPAPFGLRALVFPCACRTNRTSEDHCHRFRNAGIACIQRTFPSQVSPSRLLQIAFGRNILVLLRFGTTEFCTSG